MAQQQVRTRQIREDKHILLNICRASNKSDDNVRQSVGIGSFRSENGNQGNGSVLFLAVDQFEVAVDELSE